MCHKKSAFRDSRPGTVAECTFAAGAENEPGVALATPDVCLDVIRQDVSCHRPAYAGRRDSSGPS